MGFSRPWRANTIRQMPTAAPTTEENRITIGSFCQPSHAPIAPSSLKSPNPMPSLPVASLKPQYTSHRAVYPATAPMTAELSGANVPPRFTSNPAHSKGSVMSSGSNCVSRSIAVSASSAQPKAIAPREASDRP